MACAFPEMLRRPLLSKKPTFLEIVGSLEEKEFEGTFDVNIKMQ